MFSLLFLCFTMKESERVSFDYKRSHWFSVRFRLLKLWHGNCFVCFAKLFIFTRERKINKFGEQCFLINWTFCAGKTFPEHKSCVERFLNDFPLWKLSELEFYSQIHLTKLRVKYLKEVFSLRNVIRNHLLKIFLQIFDFAFYRKSMMRSIFSIKTL